MYVHVCALCFMHDTHTHTRACAQGCEVTPGDASDLKAGGFIKASCVAWRDLATALGECAAFIPLELSGSNFTHMAILCDA